MDLILISLLAGVLTILAPCVLSLLPVIIGGSLTSQNPRRPLYIVGSLSISVIIFSLILKGSTVLIGIPTSFWSFFAGALVTLFGLTLLFPSIWYKLSTIFKLEKSNQLLQKNVNNKSNTGAILLGASLGPVFTTCSPTYALILAIILPSNFNLAISSLIAFSIGMSLPLLAIAYGGQKVVSKLKFFANPNGIFKKVLAVILILTGLLILTGTDKKLESYLIQQGFTGLSEFEKTLIEDMKENQEQVINFNE